MAKGYWVTFYHSVKNPAVLTEYAKLATPVVQAHGGRFLSRGAAVKAYEAGIKERSVIVEFASVVEAIQSAAAIQCKMANRDKGMADAEIRFRIGVNLGDVIVDGDDIYGDGVNIAARLEAMAEPEQQVGAKVGSRPPLCHPRRAKYGTAFLSKTVFPRFRPIRFEGAESQRCM